MTTQFPDEASVARIGRGLTDRTLPKAEWTHGAHFAAALWMLREGAEARLPDLIRRYNEATGTPNTDSSGYHETITRASVAAAAAHLAAGPPSEPLHESLRRLLAGPLGRSDWLAAHWSKDRLFSVAARRDWVGPDLAPLPFPVPTTPV